MKKIKIIQIARFIIFAPIGIITYPAGVLVCSAFGMLIIAGAIHLVAGVFYPLYPDHIKEEIRDGIEMFFLPFYMPLVFWGCMIAYGSPNAPEKPRVRQRIERKRRDRVVNN